MYTHACCISEVFPIETLAIIARNYFYKDCHQWDTGRKNSGK